MKMSYKQLATDIAKMQAQVEYAALKKKIFGSSKAYARGYNFMVSIDGDLYPFMRVEGMETTAQLENFSEGGNNRSGIPLRTPTTSDHTLTFTYGCGTTNSALDTLTAGTFVKKNVMIVVMGEKLKSTSAVVFDFEGCYIKGVNFGGLDATRSEIVINSLQISYTGMQVYEDLA